MCRVLPGTAGLTTSLPRLKQDQEDADDFYPAVLAAGRYAGTQVALPEAWSPYIMYVNRGLFEQAQLPLPDHTWTYDRWLEAAARLTQADADPPIWGALFHTWGMPLLHTLWAWGGSLVSADGQRCALDSPVAVSALQWIADLWLTHRVALSPAEANLMGQRLMSQRGHWFWLFTTGQFGLWPHFHLTPNIAWLVERDSSARKDSWSRLERARKPRTRLGRDDGAPWSCRTRDIRLVGELQHRRW